MNKRKRNVLLLLFVYAVSVCCCLLKPSAEYSYSERRRLAQFPELSKKALLSGRYMEQFEKYATDQFPGRGELRFLKSAYAMGITKKQDVNGVYEENGYLCAMEYPFKEDSFERAVGIFRKIYDSYLSETKTEVYLSVIPDKNYFLAGKRHLSMNYRTFFDRIYEKMDFMTAIPIEEKLEISDYYYTDSHWRQECLPELASYLLEKMGGKRIGDYQVRETKEPFYGVYYGQAALPVSPDTMRYCESPVLEACTVYDYEKGQSILLYDMDKAGGRDAYEMFCGGNSSLLEVSSPLSDSEEELVVFGDSFSRSLVPLLAEYYRRITIYDIRYLPSAHIGKYIDFTEQDVLFLYSTSVLNNSITLK